MARDRQRAKRRRRRAGGPGRGGPDEARPAPADGAGATSPPDPKDRVAGPEDEHELDGAAAPDPHEDDDRGAPSPLRHASADVDEAEEALHGHAPEGDLSAAEQAVGDDEDIEGHAAAPPTRKGGNRVIGFLRASWAELRRVQWPDRRHTAQATAVVLGFVVVAGAFLGASDFVFSRLVDWILGI